MILRYLIKTVTIINQSSCGTEIYLDLRVHWKIKINIQSYFQCFDIVILMISLTLQDYTTNENVHFHAKIKTSSFTS